jgi:NAD/NADP transhydrogenase alpha subunit
MYSKNLQALLGHIAKEGKLVVDLADEIMGAMAITHGGEVRGSR